MEKKTRKRIGSKPCFCACRLEVERGKGNESRVLICGAEKMLTYSDSCIVFRLKDKKRVGFVGRGLVCNTLYGGAAEVVGAIENIELGGGDGN